jgi:hypothetical protein
MDHMGDSRNRHDGTGSSHQYEPTHTRREVGGGFRPIRKSGGGVSSLADDPGPPVQLDPPQTLADAQHVVASSRPRQKAPLSEWLAYHQHAAAYYAEVAEIDRGHHHEALAMAEEQRQFAMKIKAQIPVQRPVGEETDG